MNTRKIGIALVLGILTFYFWGSRRSDKKEVCMASALALLPEAEDYATQQTWYDSRGELAAKSAFQKCTDSNVGDSGEFVFDDERFLPEFFERLIGMAQNEGKMESVKALIAVRDAHEIPRPMDL